MIVSTRFDEDGKRAEVSVEDNGVGIPEEEQAMIFEIFASTKGARGTGLGLPVSDKIVREHGGKIVVHSTPGVGSRFTLELPMRESEDSAEEADGFGTMSD